MISQNANLDFSARLLPLLSDTENSVISPYGIAAVLSMAAEGANEDSQREILSALGYYSLAELRTAVLAEMAHPCEAFKSENTLTLVKGKAGVELLDQFKRSMSERYSALVDEKDSSGKPSIQIQNIASFKAEWRNKMERDTNHEHRFYHADGSESFPAFLSCTSRLRYYKAFDDKKPIVQAVALPYKYNDVEIPFDLVLVDSDKPLTASLLEKIFARMQTETCEVEFPEFSISSEFDLVPMMKSLGLQSMFDPETEAIDRMATIPLYAESFRQKAEIQVDKDGTIARALTRMITTKCGCAPDKNEIRFYKPFHYFLRNTLTVEILFMGRVNKLSDCERVQVYIDLANFLK